MTFLIQSILLTSMSPVAGAITFTTYRRSARPSGSQARGSAPWLFVKKGQLMSLYQQRLCDVPVISFIGEMSRRRLVNLTISIQTCRSVGS